MIQNVTKTRYRWFIDSNSEDVMIQPDDDSNHFTVIRIYTSDNSVISFFDDRICTTRNPSLGS